MREQYISLGAYRLFVRHSEYAERPSPSVVLVPGMGATADEWRDIQYEVSEFASVCCFDRVGVGRSDPGPCPRTCAQFVSDQRTLLELAMIPGPYVLVGHSFSGLIVRLYASLHPDDVAGMVLVEATHEDQFTRLEAILSPEQRALFQDGMRRNANAECVDNLASAAQVRDTRRSLAIPLAVLTRGLAPQRTGWTAEQTQAWEATWRELQDDLASLSPLSSHHIIAESGHDMVADQPAAIVAAIREVVKQIPLSQ